MISYGWIHGIIFVSMMLYTFCIHLIATNEESVVQVEDENISKISTRTKSREKIQDG